MKLKTLLPILLFILLLILLVISIGEDTRFNKAMEETNSFKECFNFCRNVNYFLSSKNSEKYCFNECEYKKYLEEDLQ